MAGGYRVDVRSLRSGSHKLFQTATTLSELSCAAGSANLSDDAFGHYPGLSGSCASAYHDVQSDATRDLQAGYDVLDETARALDGVAANYEHTDQGGSGNFRRLSA